ncbi:hypothetical protein E7681_00735 [Thalassobius vesicularis]|uniref:DUF6455 domain-containing protein n=1 Tax=Thalassobius vesicularis TaxID=1294297 RepID=A0A4S3ME52_9RHOB|nr:hypothetical protein E7681_00735 [Thalassobius vesicularis]
MSVIFNLGDPARHFWLTRSVARSMGLNLSEEMTTGRLSAQGYAQMVTACRKCPFVAQCENWLAHSGAGANAAPENCANAPVLNGLKH